MHAKTLLAELATLTAALLWCTSVLAAPDTLVTKGADGSYKPGAAVSWTEAAGAVTFALAADVDAAAVAKTLSDRLANAKVSFAQGKLTVAGIPAASLLEQLSTLSLSGKADPLSELAGLGGTVVAMETPEGGGSIRASRPSSAASHFRPIKDHDPAERLVAEVVGVKKGPFPAVALTLRIVSAPASGALREKLAKGQVIEASVVLDADKSGIDLTKPANQRNVAAYYLMKGDRVTVHAVPGAASSIELDWIERR